MSEQEAKEIVMEWLIEESTHNPLGEPRVLFFELMRRHPTIAPESVIQAYELLEVIGQYELLAEFAEWGLKEGADRV